jgi:TonB-dependent receptor
MKAFSIKTTFLFLIFYIVSIYGQGTIKGTVTDSLTAHLLKGARIILAGTTFNAVSDINGEFIITGIPAGDYILQAVYLSYKEKKILITVKSPKIQILNIELLPDIKNGTDLTGQAKGQAETINLQNSSNNIKNVLSGKKLRNMPDENISTALSRLPGVSILNKPFTGLLMPSSGGRSISENLVGIIFPPNNDFYFANNPAPMVLIRGMDSKFSNITIDGIRIPPTSSIDKSINLNIFPQRYFKNIELQKTITSDEDADATAGAIKIMTGKTPDKRTIRAELSGNYNRLDKSAGQYNFTGNYGERFFNNLLGVQVDANLVKKILSSEYYDLGTFYASKFSYINAFSERKGANILFDFNTPDGGSVKFNNFFNQINTDNFESRTDTNSLPMYIFDDIETKQKIFLSSIEGSNYLFDFKVDWSASYSESKTDHPFNYGLTFFGQSAFGMHLGNKPDYLDHTIDNPAKNYCKEKSVSINFSREYNISDEISGLLKFGGKYRANSRFYDESLYAETGSLSGKYQYRKLTDGSLQLKDFSGTRFDGLVGQSKFNIPYSYFQDNPSAQHTIFDKYEIPLISKDALHLWRQLNFSPYYANDGPDINSYNFSGDVFAGYLMHYLNFGQSAKFITGIRVESEHNSFSGYYFPNTIIKPDSLYTGIPKQTNTYYYNKITLLPNFQMILSLSDFLNLRLSAYKTLIRPDISARMPRFFAAHIDGISYNGADAGNYLNMGNPDLKNSDVWNYEIQTQFYGKGIGLFSIVTFYKEIKEMVQATNGIQLSGSNTIDSLGINLSSLPGNFPFNENSYYQLYTYYQVPRPARIWGFEIEHQANFRYLPGLLKNIILNYNLTFLRAETWTIDVLHLMTTTSIDILSYNKQKPDNMPEFFANVILGYDFKGFSFRVSYFYRNGYSVLDNYNILQAKEDNYRRLDIALRQEILNNFYVILNLNNITDSEEEVLVGNVPNQYEPAVTWKTNQAFRNGFNFDFGIGIDL